MEDQKQKIREIIRGVISDFAFEELAQMPAKLAQKQQEMKMTKSQRSEQIHKDIFFGGEDKDADTKYRIREGRQIKVTSMELDNFQKQVATHLEGHTIDFIEQDVKGKKAIVNFPVANEVPDAVVEAVVDNKLKFKMSLQNGLIFQTNDLKITDENKELAPKLYNLYNTVFKKTFTDILSQPEETVEPDVSAEAPAEAPMEAPEGTEDDVAAMPPEPQG